MGDEFRRTKKKVQFSDEALNLPLDRAIISQATVYTLRCNEIATIVFFQAPFLTIFRNYSVARLAMCYISKCSAGSIVLLQVQSFLSKKVQLIAISA
jgi:hypothetical protein